MIVERFEDFAARNGAGRSLFGEAGLHKRGHMSDAAHKRAVNQMVDKDRALAERRVQLLKVYQARKECGEGREPSRREQMVEKANGHPDLPSVQAARRICQKNGWLFTRHDDMQRNYTCP